MYWVVMNYKDELLKTIEDVKNCLNRHKSLLQKKFNVKRFGIFGSYARQEQTPSSDLDILVDYEELPNLLELIELENYLEEILHLKIDLVTRNGIKPQLKDSILSEVVYL